MNETLKEIAKGIITTNRIDICINGDKRLSFSTENKMENEQEIASLLKEVIQMLEAPSLPPNKDLM